MLIGTTKLIIDEETLVTALQYYFDTKTFRDGVSPKVVSIEAKDKYNNDSEFEVITEQQVVKTGD